MSKKSRADSTSISQETKLHTDAKMGKRSRKSEENMEVASNGASKGHGKSILSDETAVDPSLALLFASSVSFLALAMFTNFLTSVAGNSLGL
jgi:hypothetical protein